MRGLSVLFALIAGAHWVAAAPPPRTILVFPFENLSSRSDLNWVSESCAETLTVRLESPDRVTLRRAERDAAYAEAGLPAGVPLTLASSYRVARVLGADWAILGDFEVLGSALRLRGRLLDVARQRLGPPIEIAGVLEDLLELQTLLAWRLLTAHDPYFRGESEEDYQARFPEERLDAHENYIRGVLASDAVSRVRLLSEADRLRPNDRRAAMELGRHYFAGRDDEQAARWLRKLRPEDRDHPEALFLLGVVESRLGRHGKAAEALRELLREVPLNEAWNNLGVVEALRGRYAEAAEAFERAVQGDATDAEYAFNLAVALERLKRREEADHYFAEAARLTAEEPERHAWFDEALGSDSRAASPDEGRNPRQDMLRHLRLKENYDGRAFRLLRLALQRSVEAKLAHPSQDPEAPRQAGLLPRGGEGP
jgi:Flp pilus assembly protein TadD/TolB-like protein